MFYTSIIRGLSSSSPSVGVVEGHVVGGWKLETVPALGYFVSVLVL